MGSTDYPRQADRGYGGRPTIPVGATSFAARGLPAMDAVLRAAATTDPRVFVRLALIPLALATTSPFAPWASGVAGLLDPSHALLLAGGLLSGFLAGLLGIGGALVTLPVLYAALPGLGVPADHVPTTAVATALIAMVPTTIVAAWRQHAHGALHTDTLRRMVGPMAVGGIAGALLAAELRGPVLALMFAVQALCYGSRLVAGTADGAPPQGWRAATIARIPYWIVAPVMAAFCACVGMGGASVVTPYLQQRFALAFRQAVATASALNLSIAVGGSAAFFLAARGAPGGVALAHLPAAALLAGGAMAAVSLGVSTAHRLPSSVFRRAVGTVNLIAAVTMIAQVCHG